MNYSPHIGHKYIFCFLLMIIKRGVQLFLKFYKKLIDIFGVHIMIVDSN